MRREEKAPARSAAEFLPSRLEWPSLRAAAAGCRGCELYRRATQTVLGEGPARARIMMIGEQPGDQEDREGHPFVGPAGGLLDRACAEAGLERSAIYLTNAVKHFKWAPRGSRRFHQHPTRAEIRACRPWLEAETRLLRPQLIVCLGASAAQALFGPGFRVTRMRGQLLDASRLPQPLPVAAALLATVHPASILRMPDRDERHREFARFAADLRQAARFLASPRAA